MMIIQEEVGECRLLVRLYDEKDIISYLERYLFYKTFPFYVGLIL
jgi:hypothetical protein